MMGVRWRAQRAEARDITRAGLPPLTLGLSDAKFKLNWIGSNITKINIESSRGPYALVEFKKITSALLEKAWTPQGASEGCDLANLDKDGWDRIRELRAVVP